MAAYALAGFLIAPFAIKLWIESPNVSGPSCRLLVQRVYVNPFTMLLSLENVTLFEQENKLFVSAGRAETKVWTIEAFQSGKPGRDVAIRNLSVKIADSDETVLAVPEASARSVTVGAGGAFIRSAYVRFEMPDARITRDAGGIGFDPAWLSVPGGQRTGACISLDGIKARGGRLRITDEGVTPRVQLELRDIVAEARRKPGGGAAEIEIDAEGRVDAAGSISIKAKLGHPTRGHPDLFSMTARDVNLAPLSPYLRRIVGRDVVTGFGAATLLQERDGAAVRFDNHLSIARLRLSNTPESTTNEEPPLELSLALITDAADRSEVSIQGTMSSSPAQTVFSVFAESLAARLDKVAATPFGVLATLVGAPDAVLDNIAFLPGSAEMSPAATDTLPLLALALDQRPQLGVRVRPAYDPTADRDAIAAQQVRLHIALATSKGAREAGNKTEPDFDDARVRDILDEFAGSRLSGAQRRAIARDIRDETAMYRSIYVALVANERVSETVLRRLARFRARSVIDALEREGIDRNRFRITDALDTAATDAATVSLKVEVEARPAAHDADAHDGELGNDRN